MSRGDTRDGPPELRDAALLRELYIGQLKTCAEIGDIIGCHETSVLSWLREYNIPVRPRGSESDTIKLRDRELMQELYVERDLSQKEVAEHIGCSSSSAHDWIHYHGFDTPGSGALSGEDHPNWKGGITDSLYRLTFPKNRLKAIERDGGKCRRCSLDREWHTVVFGWDIEVHHIEPVDPEEPLEPQHRVENLITLCRPCHRKLQGLPIDNRQ